MGDRYSNNRIEDSRGRDSRPQFQQDRFDGSDGAPRSRNMQDGRGGQWNGDSQRDEFRGDRSYQNAIDEERGRGEGGGYRPTDESGNYATGGRRFNSDVDRNDWSSSDNNTGQRGSGQQFRGQQGNGYREDFGGNYDSGYSGGYNGGYGSNQGGYSGNSGGGYRRSPGLSYAGYGSGGGQMNEGSQNWTNNQRGSQQDRGEHYGKGPKGYTRSDDRIKEDLSDRFMAHPDLDASDMDLDVNQGEVTLRGNVDSRQSRRLAEEVCDDCHGVRQVNNQLRVGGQNQNSSSRRDTDANSGENTSSGSSRNRGDKSEKASH